MAPEEKFKPIPKISMGTCITVVPICWVVFPLNCLHFTFERSHFTFSSCCYFPCYPVVPGDRQIAVATLLFAVLFDEPTEMQPDRA